MSGTILDILSRSSVRQFTDEHISDEDLHIISGPSCANTRDWQFIVVRDKDTLNKMADANMKYAVPLRGADIGILILGDLDRACEGAKDFWIIVAERVENLKKLFELPDNVIPHSIMALGVPAEEKKKVPVFEEDRFHYEKY